MRATGTVAAEVEFAQRERRARALAATCKSTIDERMNLEKELLQEKRRSQAMEDKMGELLQGLTQLNGMLGDLREGATASKVENSNDAPGLKSSAAEPPLPAGPNQKM